MPPSELFRLAFDSTEDKNTTTCSNDASFVAENDYVDIVWQNGKALMSSRTRRFPSRSFDDMGEMGLKKEDDDMVPCFNNSLQHEQHCSEFVSGVTTNTQNLSSSLGTRSNVRKQDLVPHSRSLVSMNFPQFSLPAALVKASLESKVKETSLEERGSMRQPQFKKCSSSVSDGEKVVVGVASSSVWSGCNSIGRFSDGGARDLKRKSRDKDDLEGTSEDEEESMDVKRECRGKRRRVPQVHNLPERVRRDRIKKKMRALRELIPNCNNADKTSMLDEAIEYVKTLQLQLQVMSMGAGLLYAPPPMMFPPAMQHFPMVGMNYDMIGGYPMVQAPQMQGTHFMFGPSAMHFGPSCP